MSAIHRRKPGRGGASPPPKRATRWLPAAVIVVAGVIVYSNSFWGTFVLDDIKHVWDDAKIRQLEPIWRFFLHDRRPLVTLSLAINYRLGELETFGYHAFNLVVHLLAGLTLFGVVRRTLLGRRLRKDCASAAPWLALAVALIWVVHPLQTQSVTYVIQRAESMMGLFYLLTLYCAIRGADSSRPGPWYVAAVAACGAGMASKAVMVTAPVLVLIYDRAFLSSSLAEAFRRRWALYVGLACTSSILVATGVAPAVLNPQVKAASLGFAYKGTSPVEYALTQPGVLLHYLRLSFWPHPLCLDYQWPVAGGAEAIVPPVIVLVLLLAATAWAVWRRWWVGFCGAWFFVILAPTSSFIPIKDAAFEHRMYLPLAAVVVIAVVAGRRALTWLLPGLARFSVLRPVLMGALLVLVAAALGWATIRRNAVYHSRVTMYQDVVRQCPHNTRAHNNLGTALRTEERFDEAIDAYRAATQADPTYASGYHNVATILEHQGKLEEALQFFIQATRCEFGRPWRHHNLARCLAELGKTDEAIAIYRETLSKAPSDFNCRMGLAVLLVKRGEFDEAIQSYRVAAEVRSRSVAARHQLGRALRRQGRLEEAARAFGEALARDARHVSARYGLGVTLYELGRPSEAIQQLESVLELDPTHRPARQALTAARSSQQTQGKSP